MVKITVEKFAKMYVENNPGEKFNDIKSNLKTALSRKKAGVVCANCGQPIWAAGSAIVGFDGSLLVLQGKAIIPRIMNFMSETEVFYYDQSKDTIQRNNLVSSTENQADTFI